MNHSELKKTSDVFCQVGVYLITTMTVGQFFLETMTWGMSLNFAIAGFLFIVFGIGILHYVNDQGDKQLSRYIDKADIFINNANISNSLITKKKSK